MSKLKKLAIKATTSSPCMEGRNKLSVDDIINAYPEGITVTAVDLASGKDGDYCVVNFAEDDSVFFCGGSVLTNIVKTWFDECEHDIEMVNAELAHEPIGIKLSHARSKNNREYVAVTVLD